MAIPSTSSTEPSGHSAHVGLKAAASRVLGAAAQRCRVHFMRNALARAGKGQRRIVSAWIGTAFAEADPDGAMARALRHPTIPDELCEPVEVLEARIAHDQEEDTERGAR